MSSNLTASAKIKQPPSGLFNFGLELPHAGDEIGFVLDLLCLFPQDQAQKREQAATAAVQPITGLGAR